MRHEDVDEVLHLRSLPSRACPQGDQGVDGSSFVGRAEVHGVLVFAAVGTKMETR